MRSYEFLSERKGLTALRFAKADKDSEKQNERSQMQKQVERSVFFKFRKSILIPII